VACDAEGILTYFNEKTREFHGVPLENIPPEEWANYYELYTMDGKTRMDTKDIPLYRALRGEYFNEIEMVIKSRRGSSLSVLNSGQPLKDTQGNITGAVVAMHDITERKQSEYQLQKKYEELETTEEELRVSIEELQNANQKLEEQKDELEIYKKMVESSEDMMAVVDVDYKYICVNNAYLKYYHLKQEEVKGYRARDVIGDMYFEERVKSNLDKCLKGETVQYEMVRKFPEFGDVHLDIIYYPLEIGKGVEGVVSAIRDITERKKYEKELYNAKKRAEENEALTKKNLYNIEFLASSAVNFVEKKYEKDIYNFIAGKFRELNPEASIVIINEIDHDNSVIETKAFKGSDASIGKLINDLGIQIIGQQYSFDERIEGLSDGKIKKIDGGIHELSFESIPKDVAGKIENELKIERMYGIAFILNNKIYADAFLLFPKGRDIQNTDTLETFVRQASLALKRRDSEQELIKAKEKAEESDLLKSAFLANMSHEIRTPMNGILGFSQILMEGDFTKEKQNKFLGIIHSRTKHLLKIITDIVDIAKIESDQLSINKEKFYLNDIIKELYDFYQKDIKEKAKTDIKLKINLSLERERSYIKSDITRIRQILDNLVSNAIKFTDEGEVEIGYNYNSKGGLLFWVKDTGIGISIEDQEKIFERFRQADESNNRLYEGTGLGLTLSKNLVELLGGKIWVDSAKGEGSVFYFTLPCERAYKGEANEDKKESEDLNWLGKAILVVEDDPTSLEYIKEIIAPTGAEIILKETGEAGYQAFKENTSVDLILMDVRLPDISGLEIIKRIRQTDKNVKIIAQTAHAMGEDRKSCLQAGADNYIAKPIKMDNLLKIIKQHV
jgi:PAS domain S-box-containing protein